MADDRMWASAAMAGNIARSRTAAWLATTALIYPDAGHMLVRDGWAPTTPGTDGAGLGRTPVGNARPHAALWRATLAFLASTIGRSEGQASAGAPAGAARELAKPAR